MKRVLAVVARSVRSFAPIALIGAGCWQIYPPAGLMAVGALVWIETRFGA